MILDPSTAKIPSSPEKPWPDPIIQVPKERMSELTAWVDEWLDELISAHEAKVSQWAQEERDYRAQSEGPQEYPFEGACGDVVPFIAMGVDPIHARLDTGIFKTDPPFRVKPLRKDLAPYIDGLERWVNYYLKHQVKLRQVMAPRLLELVKHGTCVFKTVYDRQESKAKTYAADWSVVEARVRTFDGPRIVGVPLADFLFPALYQDVQDCPIVAERLRLTPDQLRVAQDQRKLAQVDKVINHTTTDRDALRDERTRSSNHDQPDWAKRYVECYELWFDYDIDGDGLPEHLVATYHRDTHTFLQLRYNWYFHQRKPYTVIPYTITNDSLYGLGICEMGRPTQEMLTKWHRLAMDNGYLANIRMFITRTDSEIEEVPRLYAGRVFKVEDPSKDFVPFNAAMDIYPSTLSERQNLMGMGEKRIGISDYLTGRESPMIGSRATATSTLALIQEGTRRVEEVLENIRHGISEMVTNCIWLWLQYPPGDLLVAAFEEDEVVSSVQSFFNAITETQTGAAVAVDLGTGDAMGSRAAQQQAQLAVIQVMMTYLRQLVELGQMAIGAAQQNPALSSFAGEVASSARTMFRDLLTKYDIPSLEAYLPDLQRFLDGLNPGGPAPTPPGGMGPAPSQSGLDDAMRQAREAENGGPTPPGVERARDRVAQASGSYLGLPAIPLRPQ